MMSGTEQVQGQLTRSTLVNSNEEVTQVVSGTKQVLSQLTRSTQVNSNEEVNSGDVRYRTGPGSDELLSTQKQYTQVNSGVHRSWLRSSCIQVPEQTDRRFMFSREEPAFILLLNTPEITELTPGWSQLPETHQTAAQTQRRQTPSKTGQAGVT